MKKNIPKKKVVVVGTRGIPGIMGGVETHCEELYPYIVKSGYDVTVVRRSCHIKESTPRIKYKGINLKDIYAPQKKSFEAIVHTFLGVLYAKRVKADILHIHAVGPALLAPFAKLLGLKVVVTHHGADYDRQKWNATAKFILKQGEKFGTKYSDKMIVISKSIEDDIRRKYAKTGMALIYNGVPEPVLTVKTDYITQLGLAPHKYVLALGRFVQEKGFDDLINAFSEIDNKGYKLVLAGDADHKTEYSVRLKDLAKEKGVVLTGFIKGKRLNEIMTHAGLFVLPSYHEGLPISLLEAMSYGKDVVVSNIPANSLVELSDSDFFAVGSIESLKEILKSKLAKELSVKRDYDMHLYDWDNIAAQTSALYKELL